jgi:pullulanase/glycogen debranching enzyme
LTVAKDSLWYKDAVIYQLHVRAFCDSNSDGIGDFVGLTQKLDYLQELGITAIWLLPFYVSPLRDDGYDIADYTSVHPSYGSLEDFKGFLAAAHNRGMRIIIEMVLVESIAGAQGWLLSNEQVDELEKLALGSERDNVKQRHWNSPVEFSLDFLFDGQLRADINHQYFPKDLAFAPRKTGTA